MNNFNHIVGLESPSLPVYRYVSALAAFHIYQLRRHLALAKVGRLVRLGPSPFLISFSRNNKLIKVKNMVVVLAIIDDKNLVKRRRAAPIGVPHDFS